MPQYLVIIQAKILHPSENKKKFYYSVTLKVNDSLLLTYKYINLFE